MITLYVNTAGQLVTPEGGVLPAKTLTEQVASAPAGYSGYFKIKEEAWNA